MEVSLKSTGQELNYAWLNCEDKTTAERVVKKLHGAAVGEESTMLVAHLHQQGTCVLCTVCACGPAVLQLNFEHLCCTVWPILCVLRVDVCIDYAS